MEDTTKMSSPTEQNGKSPEAISFIPEDGEPAPDFSKASLENPKSVPTRPSPPMTQMDPKDQPPRSAPVTKL